MPDTRTLPKAYDLLAELVDYVELGERPRSLLQQLVIELWKVGQTEHRAMDAYEYDPPLWCRGMTHDQVCAQVGVPISVYVSDPSKDRGRGRNWK